LKEVAEHVHEPQTHEEEGQTEQGDEEGSEEEVEEAPHPAPRSSLKGKERIGAKGKPTQATPARKQQVEEEEEEGEVEEEEEEETQQVGDEEEEEEEEEASEHEVYGMQKDWDELGDTEFAETEQEERSPQASPGMFRSKVGSTSGTTPCHHLF
ncbi:MAG: hypothetical protein ACYCU7_19190, partial [Acidimicrobiales bacterium]